jgi:hypothetical protein
MKKVMIVWPGKPATRGVNKGMMRKVRDLKGIEAEIRQEHVEHDRTRKHRLQKCECPT